MSSASSKKRRREDSPEGGVDSDYAASDCSVVAVKDQRNTSFSARSSARTSRHLRSFLGSPGDPYTNLNVTRTSRSNGVGEENHRGFDEMLTSEDSQNILSQHIDENPASILRLNAGSHISRSNSGKFLRPHLSDSSSCFSQEHSRSSLHDHKRESACEVWRTRNRHLCDTFMRSWADEFPVLVKMVRENQTKDDMARMDQTKKAGDLIRMDQTKKTSSTTLDAAMKNTKVETAVKPTLMDTAKDTYVTTTKATVKPTKKEVSKLEKAILNIDAAFPKHMGGKIEVHDARASEKQKKRYRKHTSPEDMMDYVDSVICFIEAVENCVSSFDVSNEKSNSSEKENGTSVGKIEKMEDNVVLSDMMLLYAFHIAAYFFRWDLFLDDLTKNNTFGKDVLWCAMSSVISRFSDLHAKCKANSMTKMDFNEKDGVVAKEITLHKRLVAKTVGKDAAHEDILCRFLHKLGEVLYDYVMQTSQPTKNSSDTLKIGRKERLHVLRLVYQWFNVHHEESLFEVVTAVVNSVESDAELGSLEAEFVTLESTRPRLFCAWMKGIVLRRGFLVQMHKFEKNAYELSVSDSIVMDSMHANHQFGTNHGLGKSKPKLKKTTTVRKVTSDNIKKQKQSLKNFCTRSLERFFTDEHHDDTYVSVTKSEHQYAELRQMSMRSDGLRNSGIAAGDWLNSLVKLWSDHDMNLKTEETRSGSEGQKATSYFVSSGLLRRIFILDCCEILEKGIGFSEGVPLMVKSILFTLIKVIRVRNSGASRDCFRPSDAKYIIMIGAFFEDMVRKEITFHMKHEERVNEDRIDEDRITHRQKKENKEAVEEPIGCQKCESVFRHGFLKKFATKFLGNHVPKCKKVGTDCPLCDLLEKCKDIQWQFGGSSVEGPLHKMEIDDEGTTISEHDGTHAAYDALNSSIISSSDCDFSFLENSTSMEATPKTVRSIFMALTLLEILRSKKTRQSSYAVWTLLDGKFGIDSSLRNCIFGTRSECLVERLSEMLKWIDSNTEISEMNIPSVQEHWKYYDFDVVREGENAHGKSTLFCSNSLHDLITCIHQQLCSFLVGAESMKRVCLDGILSGAFSIPRQKLLPILSNTLVSTSALNREISLKVLTKELKSGKLKSESYVQLLWQDHLERLWGMHREEKEGNGRIIDPVKFDHPMLKRLQELPKDSVPEEIGLLQNSNILPLLFQRLYDKNSTVKKEAVNALVAYFSNEKSDALRVAFDSKILFFLQELLKQIEKASDSKRVEAFYAKAMIDVFSSLFATEAKPEDSSSTGLNTHVHLVRFLLLIGIIENDGSISLQQCVQNTVLLLAEQSNLTIEKLMAKIARSLCSLIQAMSIADDEKLLLTFSQLLNILDGFRILCRYFSARLRCNEVIFDQLGQTLFGVDFRMREVDGEERLSFLIAYIPEKEGLLSKLAEFSPVKWKNDREKDLGTKFGTSLLEILHSMCVPHSSSTFTDFLRAQHFIGQAKYRKLILDRLFPMSVKIFELGTEIELAQVAASLFCGLAKLFPGEHECNLPSEMFDNKNGCKRSSSQTEIEKPTRFRSNRLNDSMLSIADGPSMLMGGPMPAASSSSKTNVELTLQSLDKSTVLQKSVPMMTPSRGAKAQEKSLILERRSSDSSIPEEQGSFMLDQDSICEGVNASMIARNSLNASMIAGNALNASKLDGRDHISIMLHDSMLATHEVMPKNFSFHAKNVSNGKGSFDVKTLEYEDFGIVEEFEHSLIAKLEGSKFEGLPVIWGEKKEEHFEIFHPCDKAEGVERHVQLRQELKETPGRRKTKETPGSQGRTGHRGKSKDEKNGVLHQEVTYVKKVSRKFVWNPSSKQFMEMKEFLPKVPILLPSIMDRSPASIVSLESSPRSVVSLGTPARQIGGGTAGLLCTPPHSSGLRLSLCDLTAPPKRELNFLSVPRLRTESEITYNTKTLKKHYSDGDVYEGTIDILPSSSVDVFTLPSGARRNLRASNELSVLHENEMNRIEEATSRTAILNPQIIFISYCNRILHGVFSDMKRLLEWKQNAENMVDPFFVMNTDEEAGAQSPTGDGAAQDDKKKFNLKRCFSSERRRRERKVDCGMDDGEGFFQQRVQKAKTLEIQCSHDGKVFTVDAIEETKVNRSMNVSRMVLNIGDEIGDSVNRKLKTRRLSIQNSVSYSTPVRRGTPGRQRTPRRIGAVGWNGTSGSASRTGSVRRNLVITPTPVRKQRAKMIRKNSNLFNASKELLLAQLQRSVQEHLSFMSGSVQAKSNMKENQTAKKNKTDEDVGTSMLDESMMDSSMESSIGEDDESWESVDQEDDILRTNKLESAHFFRRLAFCSVVTQSRHLSSSFKTTYIDTLLHLPTPKIVLYNLMIILLEPAVLCADVNVSRGRNKRSKKTVKKTTNNEIDKELKGKIMAFLDKTAFGECLAERTSERAKTEMSHLLNHFYIVVLNEWARCHIASVGGGGKQTKKAEDATKEWSEKEAAKPTEQLNVQENSQSGDLNNDQTNARIHDQDSEKSPPISEAIDTNADTSGNDIDANVDAIQEVPDPSLEAATSPQAPTTNVVNFSIVSELGHLYCQNSKHIAPSIDKFRVLMLLHQSFGVLNPSADLCREALLFYYKTHVNGVMNVRLVQKAATRYELLAKLRKKEDRLQYVATRQESDEDLNKDYLDSNKIEGLDTISKYKKSLLKDLQHVLHPFMLAMHGIIDLNGHIRNILWDAYQEDKFFALKVAQDEVQERITLLSIHLSKHGNQAIKLAGDASHNTSANHGKNTDGFRRSRSLGRQISNSSVSSSRSTRSTPNSCRSSAATFRKIPLYQVHNAVVLPAARLEWYQEQSTDSELADSYAGYSSFFRVSGLTRTITKEQWPRMLVQELGGNVYNDTVNFDSNIGYLFFLFRSLQFSDMKTEHSAFLVDVGDEHLQVLYSDSLRIKDALEKSESASQKSESVAQESSSSSGTPPRKRRRKSSIVTKSMESPERSIERSVTSSIVSNSSEPSQNGNEGYLSERQQFLFAKSLVADVVSFKLSTTLFTDSNYCPEYQTHVEETMDNLHLDEDDYSDKTAEELRAKHALITYNLLSIHEKEYWLNLADTLGKDLENDGNDILQSGRSSAAPHQSAASCKRDDDGFNPKTEGINRIICEIQLLVSAPIEVIVGFLESWISLREDWKTGIEKPKRRRIR